jgi:hypothetical protein
VSVLATVNDDLGGETGVDQTAADLESRPPRADRPMDWLPWLSFLNYAYDLDLDRDRVDCTGIEDLLETFNPQERQFLI